MDNQKKDSALKDQVALLSFVDAMIKEKKDPNITPESLPKVREYLLNELNQAINMRLVTLLQDADKVTLTEMLDRNASNDEVMDYLSSKIPNIEIQVAAAMINFRSTYVTPIEDLENGKMESLESFANQAVDMPPPAPVAPVSITYKQTSMPPKPPVAPIPSDKLVN